MYMGARHDFEADFYYPPPSYRGRQVGSRPGLPRNDRPHQDYFSPNADPRYDGFYDDRQRRYPPRRDML
jgi:hypothetical protein